MDMLVDAVLPGFIERPKASSPKSLAEKAAAMPHMLPSV